VLQLNSACTATVRISTCMSTPAIHARKNCLSDWHAKPITFYAKKLPYIATRIVCTVRPTARYVARTPLLIFRKKGKQVYCANFSVYGHYVVVSCLSLRAIRCMRIDSTLPTSGRTYLGLLRRLFLISFIPGTGRRDVGVLDRSRVLGSS
jgi:hypothetical protein